MLVHIMSTAFHGLLALLPKRFMTTSKSSFLITTLIRLSSKLGRRIRHVTGEDRLKRASEWLQKNGSTEVKEVYGEKRSFGTVTLKSFVCRLIVPLIHHTLPR
jgi:hypothetical protein